MFLTALGDRETDIFSGGVWLQEVAATHSVLLVGNCKKWRAPKASKSRHQLYLYAKKEQKAEGGRKAGRVYVCPQWNCSSNGCCSCLTPFTHSGRKRVATEEITNCWSLGNLLYVGWTRFMGESTEKESTKERREKREAWELSTTWDYSLYNFLEVLNEATKESKASQVFPNSPPSP